MSTRHYVHCLKSVPDRGTPPASFLDILIDTLKALPDEVFVQNPNDDIYNKVNETLGPFTSILQRRAVMAEALRVLAGFESSWNWNEGRDTSAGPETPEEEESGAFQVSANSMAKDPSLPACVDRLCGHHDVTTFIHAMKTPKISVEYCARLLRVSTSWDGPIDRGELQAAVSRAAVTEFEGFMAAP